MDFWVILTFSILSLSNVWISHTLRKHIIFKIKNNNNNEAIFILKNK